MTPCPAPSILVIDSDPIQMTGTAAVLDMAGYSVWCARDREAAIKAARCNPLDLILCDVNLAGESGVDLCRDIRNIPGCDDIPLMFMAAGQITDVVRRTSEMGSAYFLRKPFDPDVLIELVSKAMWMPHLVSAKMSKSAPAPIPMPADSPVPTTSMAPAPKHLAIAERATMIG